MAPRSVACRCSLYGIAAGTLRRYTVPVTKPGAGDITGDGLIGTGFALKTLTTTGPDWLLGTASGRARGRSSGRLLSAGGGVYFGHNAEGGLLRYTDANPFDGSGADLSGSDAVDAQGWSEVALSVQPGTVG
ncbi:hypothetical protein B0I31_11724 [Saccharothrix carnea]|uniref:Uncharacterized protein n=1 Tax=Saccharothrix carnea TaxID=1280637 RepID=A0A2P8I028_SACCR|nr:hypothetical protein [Saccharothrix carnea]PSL51830.1 hypothetical protein B0I31_11724 [Saccharothrix carnea]